VALLLRNSYQGETYEVYPDGGDVALRVRVICETKEQARLSNTGVSDEEELEEIIVSIISHVSSGWMMCRTAVRPKPRVPGSHGTAAGKPAREHTLQVQLASIFSCAETLWRGALYQSFDESGGIKGRGKRCLPLGIHDAILVLGTRDEGRWRVAGLGDPIDIKGLRSEAGK
jgi:hypothetical protein